MCLLNPVVHLPISHVIITLIACVFSNDAVDLIFNKRSDVSHELFSFLILFFEFLQDDLLETAVRLNRVLLLDNHSSFDRFICLLYVLLGELVYEWSHHFLKVLEQFTLLIRRWWDIDSFLFQ